MRLSSCAAQSVARPTNPACSAWSSVDQPVAGTDHCVNYLHHHQSPLASPANISLILQQVAVIAALAVGQTLIILTAGIDLSVGYDLHPGDAGDGQTLAANNGVPAVLALLIGFAVGTLCGWLNGALITRLKLPPFIATRVRSACWDYYQELKSPLQGMGASKIFAGMIPKLDNAFAAINCGVKKVIIGKAEQLKELINGEAGTNILNE